MHLTEALNWLLQNGAANISEIMTAIQAVNQNSPIRETRVLRAITHSKIAFDQYPEAIQRLIAELAEANHPRGVLPQGGQPKTSTIQGRVSWPRKKHWNNYARENGLTLWGLIEQAVDQRTGYREE